MTASPAFTLRKSHNLSFLPDWLYRDEAYPRVEVHAAFLRIIAPDRRGFREETELALDQLGDISLHGRSCIELRGRRPAGEVWAIKIPVGRLVAEDHFDAFQHALDPLPTRPFSITEDHVVRYADGFAFDQLFPWQADTQSAASSDQALTIRTDSNVFRVRTDHPLRVTRDGDEHPDACLGIRDDRIVDRFGTTVALIHRLYGRSLGFVFGDGTVLQYHRRTQAVFRDGQRVGQMLNTGDARHLALAQPIPEVFAVCLMLATRLRSFPAAPQKDRMAFEDESPTLDLGGQSMWLLAVIGVGLAVLATTLALAFESGVLGPFYFLMPIFGFWPLFLIRVRNILQLRGRRTHIEVPNVTMQQSPELSHLHISPWDLGHVSRSITGKPEIRFGVRDQRSSQEVILHGLASGTEKNDAALHELRAHLERVAPSHHYSYLERGQLHHNRPFELAELLPFCVRATRAELVGDHIHLETLDYTMQVTPSSDGRIQFLCTGVDGETPILQVTSEWIVFANGMLLGRRSGTKLSFATATPLSIRIDPATGDAYVDNACAGRTRIDGDRITLELDRPVPDIALVLALAVYRRAISPSEPH